MSLNSNDDQFDKPLSITTRQVALGLLAVILISALIGLIIIKRSGNSGLKVYSGQLKSTTQVIHGRQSSSAPENFSPNMSFNLPQAPAQSIPAN
ncbi:MAG: hypothetical protein E6Q32_04230 [Neisseriales bacterium]|nr:MAG: hypothetical protein E6Q32_04230 [Neisseriales bacterium]